jgi:hypothetical protein
MGEFPGRRVTLRAGQRTNTTTTFTGVFGMLLQTPGGVVFIA